MKKALVVYSTISGFTKKYAEWIAGDLGTTAVRLPDLDIAAARQCDIVVYGGNLHAVGINGLKKFKRIAQSLENKTIVVFACGASPGRQEDIDKVLRHNFTDQERGRYAFFYLRGGFDINKLNFFNRLLMRLMKRMLARKKNRTADEQGMLEAIDNPVDYTQKENVSELVDFCTSKG
jgi:menaquinone-dependent protoporphyrinogen IX oxidase